MSISHSDDPDFFHTRTDEMVCPYCRHVNRDSWEYSKDDGYAWCGECDAKFRYCRNITVTYTTSREDPAPGATDERDSAITAAVSAGDDGDDGDGRG